MSKTIVIQGSRSSSGNSILSYITPWLGRILGIVILIVVIIAIAKLLGGNIFNALQGLLGTANAASHALTNQITSCGFAAPPTVSCDSSQKNPCIDKQKCSAGQCVECSDDNDCEDRYDSGYTCASTGMCKAPGFPGGLFNNGCMIGWGLIGYFALQMITTLGVTFFGWAKSRFVKKIEAITGTPVTDGLDINGILESVEKEVDNKIEELQSKKKLPYKDDDGNWRKPNPDGGEDTKITESEAKDILNNYRKKMVKEVNKRALQKKMARNAKAKESESIESQKKIEQALNEKQAQDRAAEDEDRAEAEKIDEVYPDPEDINSVVDNVIGE